MASLNDSSPSEELTTELEEIIDEYWLFFGQSRKVRYITHASKSLLLTGMKDPFFNGVISFKYDFDNSWEEVVKTLGFFYRNRIPMTWWITPSTRPKDLQNYLNRLGLNLLASYPGMTMILSEDLLYQTEKCATDINIERVRTTEKLIDWISVFQIGFQSSKEVSFRLFEIYKELGLREEQSLQHFIGYNQHVPVAISSVLYGRKIASIWSICTHPKYQRRGFGRALTIAPLISAMERGYQKAGLFASEKGASVYRNIGFQTTMSLTHYISRW